MSGYYVSGMKVVNDGSYKLLVKNKCSNDTHEVHWSKWEESDTKEGILNRIKESLNRNGIYMGSCIYRNSALTKKMKDIIDTKAKDYSYIFELYRTDEFKKAFLEMIDGKIKRCDYNFSEEYY